VDLLVIGRGVAGLTTALALSEAGLNCAVAEAPGSGGLDDPADCELTALRAPWSVPVEVVQLAERTRALYPALAARLGQATGVDCEYRRLGLVLAGEVSSAGLAWLAETEQPWHQGRLADFEPGLAWGQGAAVLLSGVDQVRRSRWIRALELALRQRGVAVFRDRPVRRLEVRGNVVRGAVLASGEGVRADAVIVAADQASSGLLHASGLDPLDEINDPVPRLRLHCGESCARHAVQAGELDLVPRPDGRLLASLADPVPDVPGLSPFDRLLTTLANWLPSLNRFDIEARWVGPPAGGYARRPFVGAYPWIRGLWINAGHQQAGPAIAPAAAELIVDQLNGGPTNPRLAVRTGTARREPAVVITHR
jgi:glycine oxidase